MHVGETRLKNSVRTITLEVPYRGQRFDVARWREDGFDTAREAEYWGGRSCGVACVGMILDYYTGRSPENSSLLKDGIALGGYCSRGWIHRSLAELLCSHGVPAHATPMASPEEQIVEAIENGTPFVASVSDEFPIDGSKSGHLVVVTGFTQDGAQLAEIRFNDPSGWGRTHPVLPAWRFLASFSGRVVIPSGTAAAPW